MQDQPINCTQAVTIPYLLRKNGHWVWRCSDASIEAGRPSVLAVLEVLLAVTFFWLIAGYSDWPWMLLISLLAAPLLLLRSPQSVTKGLQMLSYYWQPKALSQRQQWLLAGLGAVCAALVSYGLISLIDLPNVSSWKLWLSWFVIAFVISLLAIGVAVAVEGAHASSFVFMGTFAGASAVAVVATGTGTDTFVVLFAVTVAGVVMIGRKGMVGIGAGAGLGLGVLLRATWIRLLATLSHPLLGLQQLPHNWSATLAHIDVCHLPELLPDAKQISDGFAAQGVWLVLKYSNEHAERFIYLTLLLLWCSPAYVYRWSLKASAWLWWPFVLLLTPPFRRLDLHQIRRRTALNSRGAGWWLTGALFSMFGLCLFKALYPELVAAIAALLPLDAQAWLNYLPAIPTLTTARFITLCLFCLCAAAYLWLSYNMRAAYSAVLDSPKGLQDLTSSEQQQFVKDAKPIERLRMVMIVCIVFFAQAWAVLLFQQQNPELIASFNLPWLIKLL